MKICVLGPIYPYRGGIAYYTTQLVKALKKRHKVVILSYSMQYPRILYRRGDQKDDSSPEMEEPETEFILNTAVPSNWNKVAARINSENPNILILPWWHPYFAPCYWGIKRKLKDDIPILFICHNVLPHELFPMQRIITRKILKSGSGFMVHSKQDESLLKDIIGNEVLVKRLSLPISELLDNEKNNITKSDLRNRMGFDDNDIILLFFGFVREYKGLKVLLRAFPQISHRNDQVKLLIVGEFSEKDKSVYEQLINESNDNDSIMVISEYVPDNCVGEYFSACDVVVLPYLSATQSGVIPMAYAYKRPVITTNVGGLAEVVHNAETGYVISPGDEKALVDAVEIFIEDRNKKDFESAISEMREKMSWGGYAKIVEEIASELQTK